MKTSAGNRIAVMAIIATTMMGMLLGCQQSEQTEQPDQAQRAERGAERSEGASDRPARPATSAEPPDRQAGPLEHVAEFDGFTLRASVGRTDSLQESVARQYQIEPEADVFLINLVILEHRADRPVPVAGEVTVQHESLSGHIDGIAMRPVEANGHISYIGTLDGRSERFFRIVIEAQPDGSDAQLNMDFDVRLEAFEVDETD